MRIKAYAAILAAAATMVPAHGRTGELVYTPINPSFGGNPFNSAHLLALATAQNQNKPEPKPQEERSASDRFIQMLQSRLYSGLAQQVSEAIFGEDTQPEGTFVFDDQEIHFVNDGDQITLTIINHTTGDTTEISVPTIVSSQ